MQNSLFIRIGKEYSPLPFIEIIYIEALRNYVRIVTRKEKFLIKIAMKRVEESLPRNQFCRIHRSYIIGLSHISGFNSAKVHILERHLPISNPYRDNFRRSILTFKKKYE